MSKKPKPQAEYTGPIFQPGTAIFVKRPNLHFGYSGSVISVNEKTGEHLLKLTHRGGLNFGEFGAMAIGTELELVDLLA